MKKTIIFFLIIGIILIISSLDYNSQITKEIEIVEDDGEILVPITAHLISDRTQEFTTDRDPKNIKNLFEEANRIWSPAQIKFVVEY